MHLNLDPDEKRVKIDSQRCNHRLSGVTHIRGNCNKVPVKNEEWRVRGGVRGVLWYQLCVQLWHLHKDTWRPLVPIFFWFPWTAMHDCVYVIGIIFLPSSVVSCRRSNHKNSICSKSTIDHPHSSGGKREHPVDEVFGRLPLWVESPTRPVWKSAKASGES